LVAPDFGDVAKGSHIPGRIRSAGIRSASRCGQHLTVVSNA
jgi:hypothetical protein